MSKCSIENKEIVAKGFIKDYVSGVRPSLGKSPIKDSDLEKLIEFAVEMEKANLAIKELVDGSNYVKGEMKNINSQVPKRFNGKISFKDTVFNSMKFTTNKDKVTDDNTYLVEGEQKKFVENSLNTIVKMLNKSGIKAQLKSDDNGYYLDNTVGISRFFEGNVIASGRVKIFTNMALGMFFTKEIVGGKTVQYRANMHNIMALNAGIIEGLGEQVGSVIGHKDDQQIADIAGVPEDRVNDYLRYKFGMGGTSLSLFSVAIGNSVKRSMGLTFDKDISEKDKKEMVMSLGLLANEIINGMDIVEPNTVDMEKAVTASLKRLGLSKEDGSVDKNKVEGLTKLLKSKKGDSILKARDPDLSMLNGWVGEKNAAKFRSELFNYIGYNAKGVLFEDLYKGAADRKYRAVHTYVIFKKGAVSKVKKDAELFEDFVDVVNVVKEPSFEPVTRVNMVKRNDEVSELSASQIEYLETAQSVPYKFNSGMTAMMKELEGKTDEEIKDILRKALKYPELREDVSMTTRLGNESRRDRIDKVIEDVLGFYKKAEGRPFYFEYFMPGNNRAMIKSTTLDPHNDKEFARWLVSQDKEWNFSREDLVELLAKDVLTYEEAGKLNPALLVTIIGTVQAFDGEKFNGKSLADVEKNILQNMFESFKAVMKSDREDLVKAMWEGNGHVGQKATVLAMYDSYMKGGDSVDTSVAYEVDGLTNALFYRVLQTPMPDNDFIKEKVGVVPTERAADANHMGDIRSKDPNYTDNYLNLGSKSVSNMIRDFGNTPLFNALVDNKLFIIEDVENTLTKAVRDFAKPGTMIINYGAGVKKILQAAVDAYLYGNGGLIDKLLEKKDGKYIVSDEVFSSITNVKGADKIEAMREKLRNTDSVLLKKDAAFFPIHVDISGLFGWVTINDKEQEVVEGPLPDALNEVYGSYMEAGNALIEHQNAMFDIFKEKLRGISRYNDTKEQIVKNMKSLYRIMPSILRPDSLNVFESTNILGKSTVSEIEGATNSITNYNNPSGGSIGTTALHMESLKGTILSDVIEKPGAKGLPFATHTHDNLDAMNSTMKVYKDSDKDFMLQIFDALVITPGTFKGSQVHNETAMMSNLEYFAYEDAVMRFKLLDNEFNSYMENLNYNNPALAKRFKEARDNLTNSYNTMVNERAGIFGKDHAVMQMSGAVNSRYDYVVKDVLKKEQENYDKALKELQEYDLGGDIVAESIVKGILDAAKDGGLPMAITKAVYHEAVPLGWYPELAAIVQKLKAADVAIRSIKGMPYSNTVASTVSAKDKTKEYNIDEEGLVGTMEDVIKGLPAGLKNSIRKRLKELLDEDTSSRAHSSTLINKILEGCK